MRISSFKTDIPTYNCGPIKTFDLSGIIQYYNCIITTFEKTLIPSINRGALISRLTDGIKVHIGENKMTRSVIFSSEKLESLIALDKFLKSSMPKLQECVSATSRYCKIIDIHSEIVADLIFVRFGYNTDQAAGHNMTTKASNAIVTYVLNMFQDIHYVSLSGNYCTDKKNSAINGILGRGRRCSAEIYISRDICVKNLHATPEQIVDLNYKKNYIGSILAGSVRSANTHFANIILGFYLATGQDAANIIEGSQGLTVASIKDNGLYFSVNCPNIIIGSIGNGKEYPSIVSNMHKICQGDITSEILCKVLISAILCGELSLIGSLTDKDDIVRAHDLYERKLRRN